MRILADLAGTLRNSLRIGRATIVASDLSTPRTLNVPDQNIDLTPNSSFQAYSQNLSALSGLNGAANKAPYFTDAGAMSVFDLQAFGRSLVGGEDAAAARETLELVKQSSQTDTTTGAVMLNGAHGLGSVLSSEPAIADFATIMPSGFYRGLGAAAAGATANAPPGSGNSQLGVLCVRILSNTCYYYVFENGGSPAARKFWLGQNNSGTVTWQQVYHDGNLDNTESGWLTPTLVNSYTQGTDPVRYRRIGKFGVVTGTLRRSAPPGGLQTICTLPAGYRPTKQHSITVLWISDNLASQVTNIAIGTDGSIATGLIYTLAGTPSGAGGTFFTLIFPVS